MKPLDTNARPVYLVIGIPEQAEGGGYVERIHKVFACDLSEAAALYQDVAASLNAVGQWAMSPHIYRREPPNPFRDMALTPVDIEAIMKEQEEKKRGGPPDATATEPTP